MTDTLIPNRERELADRSYRMLEYTWFRVVGKLDAIAYPHYLGRGLAFNSRYNIRDVWQAPMPNHIVLKFSLSAGGAVAQSTKHSLRLVKPGEVILRFVEEPEFWEGYQPNFKGKWEFLGLICSGLTAVQTATALIGEYGRVYNLGLEHPIYRRLRQLCREPNHSTEITASSGYRLCTDLFAALLDSAEVTAAGRTSHLVNKADAIEATIRGDLRRDWSVEALAEHHDISREHLTRIFTRRFGIAPHRYIVELRMQEACRLLRTGHDSIKSIVMKVGFKSHANFVRAFRHFNGMSPTEYRNRRPDATH